MPANHKLAVIQRNIRRYGSLALQNARSRILDKYTDDGSVSTALRYFSETALNDALPVFPALIGMSSEAVGGKLEDATLFGEAIVLITAAADLHDDIIDNSIVKRKRETVLGKFGYTTAILAGDVLLVEGLRRLSEACGRTSKENATKIMSLVSDAVVEISAAETLENQLRTKANLGPNEYQEVIRLKSVVPELTAKIGAIIGNGNSEQVERLGQFGRLFGVTSAIVEEFADLMEVDELENRLKNECPPLPLLCALQNTEIKSKIASLLNSQQFLKKAIHEKIVDIILAAEEVAVLQKTTISEAKSAMNKLTSIDGNLEEKLANLILVPLSYLE